MDLSLLEKVRKIVAHIRCADGIGSVMILRDAGLNVPVELVEYNTPEHLGLVAEPGLLLCDMTPPEGRVQEFVDAGAIVLDHHKEAKSIVQAFGDRGVFADEYKEPGVSGAMLAYREVWVPRCSGRITNSTANDVQEFARLLGIRDTWQKSDKSWEVACALSSALKHMPAEYCFNFWVPLCNETLDTMINMGRCLEKDLQERAQDVALSGMWEMTDAAGTLWAVVTIGKRLFSDVAEALRARGYKQSLSFNQIIEGGRPYTVFSLRSDGTVDVGKIAKRMEGGGHSRASGFKVKGWITPAELFMDYEMT